MKKIRAYHGTVTGKDDIFLENFIVTGAVSGKTTQLMGQRSGFYVIVGDQETAVGFADTRDQEESSRDPMYRDDPLNFGRGMVVELEVELNAKDWDIDHEMSQESLRVIKEFRQELPSLTFNTSPFQSYGSMIKTPFQVSDYKNGSGFVVIGDEIPRFSRLPVLYEGGYSDTLILDRIHKVLEETFPERYLQVKQRVLDEVEIAHLKYIGHRPLPVEKIYLRPLEYPSHAPLWLIEERRPCADWLAQWEVAYERTAPGAPQQQARLRSAAAPQLIV